MMDKLLISGSEEYFLSRIKWYRMQYQKLINLFDGHSGRIEREHIELAREQLRELKKKLSEDQKVGCNSRFKFSAAAQKYYRVVHEAQTRISVPVNSIPSQKWISDLNSFMVDIKFYYPANNPTFFATEP